MKGPGVWVEVVDWDSEATWLSCVLEDIWGMVKLVRRKRVGESSAILVRFKKRNRWVEVRVKRIPDQTVPPAEAGG